MIAGTLTARLLPRTKPKGRHPQKALSAAFVRSAPPGRHADGNGLYLFVQPSGTRSWIQRLLVRGRRRELGLGSLALVPLAEAREKALVNRKLARQGGDPLAEKRRSQAVPTFAEAAMRVLEQKRAGWRNPRHPREWISSLRRLAFPRIGKMPVSEVTSADVLEILTPIWHRTGAHSPAGAPAPAGGPGMGRSHGVPHGQPLRPDRPGAGSPTGRYRAHAGLAPSGGGCGDPDGADIGSGAGRPAGLRVPGADGSQVGRGAVGRVGGDRSGAGGCGPSRPGGQRRTAGTGCRCVDVPWRFSRQRRHSGREPVHWCSPMGAGSHLHDSQLRRLLRELGIAAVPHGFRSSFRDWAGEETDHPREVIEAALAHVVRNRVEAAYARSDLFERRRLLMDDWCALLGPRDGGGVGALIVKRPRDRLHAPGPARRPRPGQSRVRARLKVRRQSKPG